MKRADTVYRLSVIALLLASALLGGVLFLGGSDLIIREPSATQPTAVDGSAVNPAGATTTPGGKPAVSSTPATPSPEPSETPTPTPSATPSATPTATASATPSPAPSSTSSPTASASTEGAPATEEPDPPAQGASVLLPATPVPDLGSAFDNRIWVGLYGTPGGRGLGILGTAPATDTVTMTVRQAIAYQELLTTTQVVPIFHMVTTVADPFPGADGDYVHHVRPETIQLWVDVARDHGVFSVLDIQPGHSPIEAELAYVDPFIRQLGVHLAFDPEFLMLDGYSVPGEKIGTMTGAQVNVVQAWLNEIAGAIGERKVLVIHQFDGRMFIGKEEIVDYPFVDLVWDADGFGGPGPKIADYTQYAGEPGFEFGGFKLFYNYDAPLMTPAQVLGLEPFPAFVIYQ